MKYLNIFLIVLIAVLIIGGGVWFFFFNNAPGSTNTQTATSATGNHDSGAAAFTTSFYQWYLDNLMKDPHFSVTNSPEQKKWVSAAFVDSIETKFENNALFSDPVILSEDYQGDWVDNISAKVTRESTTESVVLVTLGGRQPQTLSVRLVKSDNAWVVDSVSRP